jgi:hypothetical protein
VFFVRLFHIRECPTHTDTSLKSILYRIELEPEIELEEKPIELELRTDLELETQLRY